MHSRAIQWKQAAYIIAVLSKSGRAIQWRQAAYIIAVLSKSGIKVVTYVCACNHVHHAHSHSAWAVANAWLSYTNMGDTLSKA